MAIIQVKDLSRDFKVLKHQEGLWGTVKDLISQNYQTIKAVSNLSMEIEEGGIVGFLGPNGAGKSTTIKMLTGVLKPTSGMININGFVPYKERRKYTKIIGVVLGQRSQLWWDLPVIESFKLLKELYEIDSKTYTNNLGLFDELAGINKFFSAPTRNLSLGQRMLCDIAASFLHDPKIIFLDEPTIGLDVNIKKKVTAIIKQFVEIKKTTVLLTSHDMSNIETLCDRIILIDHGQLVYDGNIDKFISKFGAYRTLELEIENINAVNFESINHKLNDRFDYGEKWQIGKKNDAWLTLEVPQEKVKMFEVLNYLSLHVPIKDVKINEMQLEHAIQKSFKK